MTNLDQPNRLKVVILAKWYPDRLDPQLGVFIQKHAKAIAAFAEVIVFYARSVQDGKARPIEEHVSSENGFLEYRYYYKTGPGLIGKAIGLVRYLQCWNRFVKTTGMRNHPPDLLHAYVLLRTGFVALLERFRFGTPFVVSEQWSGYLTGKFEGKPFLWKSLWRSVVKRAKGISAVSEHLRSALENLSGRNDIEVFNNVIDRQAEKSFSKQTANKQMLVVADLVDEIKNVSGVLKAFRSVISQHPEWRLHIIGGGPDRAFLESMSAQLGLKSSQVVFEGLQPNHIVYQRIRECSFLIMNSRFETFSSVCTEALCCGKPVIATRCGGPQEYIGPEQGVLITPDNQQELIDGINWMVEHHMKFIPEDLAQYADKKFGYESIGQRFSRWYQAVLHPQVRPVD